MQQLSVNLTIAIPEDHVLVSKVELERLKKNELVGFYWSLKDLENRTGKKRSWLQDNILYIPRFKKLLDVNNGGFVYYPSNKGQSWSFHARKMSQFLDRHFTDIYKGS
ncbi:DUF771 domain-containing protein [Jeotgalibacillus campisalis]|uniref:DUF771 domain-containing protein n=1 Tax=Jeotgalibacillus campisalis TaxID=220754 RepID=UPI0005972228|nr:DUF771 domain-containing protein [Jeotgalibacillus campisalis]